MPWATVRDIAIEGETSMRLTGTRAATIGVFALGAKKRTRDTHISVLTNTAERGFLLEKTAPEAIKTRLMPLLAKLAEQQEPEPEAGHSKLGIADEIAKLAELRGSGVLTDEEFHAQKAKLLG